MKSIGRPVGDCGNETPLEYFFNLPGKGGSPNRPRTIEVNRPYPFWIVAHLNELTASDFELLERSNSKFHVVHCPRSHNYFGHTPFAFDRLRWLGFNVCLGTDSLASNETLSLFDEMRAFQKNFPRISPEEIFQMVTVNSRVRCNTKMRWAKYGLALERTSLQFHIRVQPIFSIRSSRAMRLLAGRWLTEIPNTRVSFVNTSKI
jgi:hypothetical protein